jgi:hypothetical protein
MQFKKEVIMPGLNQRGPMGQGSMTGRRIGRCTDFGASAKKEKTNTDEDLNQNQPENFQGRGFGFRSGIGCKGRGLGLQNRYRRGF